MGCGNTHLDFKTWDLESQSHLIHTGAIHGEGTLIIRGDGSPWCLSFIFSLEKFMEFLSL